MDYPISRRRLIGTVAASPMLAAAIPAVMASHADNDWRPLFDGRSLKGWRYYEDGGIAEDRHGAIQIERGVLHFLGPKFRGTNAPTGHISTIERYGNYHLRLAFRWGERRFVPRKLQRRNSGILYHLSPVGGRLFPPGIEFQIEESDVGDAIMIDTLALQGPVLGGTPLWPNYFPGLPQDYVSPLRSGGIARQWLRHAGHFEMLTGWNLLDLIVMDDQAAHLVNGRIVNTMYKMVRPEQADHVPLTSGHIALEFEQAEIYFRDVMIRPLSTGDIATIRAQGSY